MTCNTFIIPQSENTGSYRVISWVSLKGKTPLGTKNSRCDPALPCWFTEEPRAHQESGSCDSDSHTKPRSLSYTEFLLWEQTLPKCIPATDRELRLNWGLKIHKKEMRLHQAGLPGWPFPTAHHGLAVASCPQEQPVQNPRARLRTESCQPHPRLLELELLNNSQHEAFQPSCQPICFLKDYLELTGKNTECIFK